MNLQQYQTNLINIEELLLTIKKEGTFAENVTRGYVQASIEAEYFHSAPHGIGSRAANVHTSRLGGQSERAYL